MPEDPLAQLLSVARSLTNAEEQFFVEPTPTVFFVPPFEFMRPSEAQDELDWIREQSEARFRELRPACIDAGIAAGFRWKAEERVSRLINVARGLRDWEQPFSVPEPEFPDGMTAAEHAKSHFDRLLKRLRDAISGVEEMAAAVPTSAVAAGQNGGGESVCPPDNADTRADKKKVRHPSNPDVCDLCAKLARELPKGKSQRQIARDYTGGNEQMAERLLRQCRRYKHLYQK